MSNLNSQHSSGSPSKIPSKQTSSMSSKKSTSVPLSKLIEAEKHIQAQQQRLQQQKQPPRIKPAPLATHQKSNPIGSTSAAPKTANGVRTSQNEPSCLPELVISSGKPSSASSSSRPNTTSKNTSIESSSKPKRVIEVGKAKEEKLSPKSSSKIPTTSKSTKEAKPNSTSSPQSSPKVQPPKQPQSPPKLNSSDISPSKAQEEIKINEEVLSPKPPSKQDENPAPRPISPRHNVHPVEPQENSESIKSPKSPPAETKADFQKQDSVEPPSTEQSKPTKEEIKPILPPVSEEIQKLEEEIEKEPESTPISVTTAGDFAVNDEDHPEHTIKRSAELDVPKAELGDEMKTKSFNISTLFRMTFADVSVELTPDFKGIEVSEYDQAFLRKVKECKKICDWSIGIKDVEAKKNKKFLLIQLIELFEANSNLDQIQPTSIDKFISMVVQNISRPFPPTKVVNPLFDFDDVTQDMAWPHLALVYEALLKLLMSSKDVTINHATFVSVLVCNSCSPDERERMAARDNLKFLFVKCPDLRDTILRHVENQFLTGVCSHQLLEFMLTVLDEVGRPLPDNFIRIYQTSILFLHSSKLFMKFYKAFFACVNRFVRAERSLLKPTIEYLVRHWPSSTVRKQLIFMSEMEGLTLNYYEDVNEEIAKMVFTKLSELVNEPNIDIAETALNVIMGQALEEPLLTFAELAIQTLTQELMNAANKNWNEFVQEDSKLALQLLSDLNPTYFKAQVGRLKEERKKKKTYQGIWRTNWKKVVESAKLNDSSITSANMDMLF